MNNLDQTILLNSSGEMQSIAKPLKDCFGIDYFGYLKTYADNSHIALTTNVGWLECFYKNFHEHGVIHKSIDSYQDGYYLGSEAADQTTIQVMRNDFNIDHDLAIVRTHKDYLEFYTFAVEPQKSNIKNWYLNNIHILEQFILYFKETGKTLIQTAEKDRYILPRHIEQPSEEPIYSAAPNKIDDFLNKIKMNRYYLSHDPEIYLTQMEFLCVSHSLKGLSSKQIAMTIGLSYRTVDSYLESVKKKLDVQNKTSMLIKVLNHFPWLKKYMD